MTLFVNTNFEIEVGKTSCGTLTSILLIQLQDNPQEFLPS